MNRKQMNNLITLYNLNLDYRIEDLTLEEQTNILINNIFQTINIDMKKNNIDTYILEFNDDELSVLCYKILVTLRTMLKFQLYLTKKPKLFKDFIDKKEKVLNNRIIKKIDVDKTIKISTNNPIYKVFNITLNSNKNNLVRFHENYNKIKITREIINNFTYNEIIEAFHFYNVNIDFNLTNENYYNLDKCDIDNDLTFIDKICYNNFKEYDKEIIFVKFGENDEYNNNLLNDIEQEEKLIFYYINNNKIEWLVNSPYKYYVEKTVNRPNRININNSTAPIIVNDFNQIKFVGNWTNDDMQILEDFYNGFCC